MRPSHSKFASPDSAMNSGHSDGMPKRDCSWRAVLAIIILATGCASAQTRDSIWSAVPSSAIKVSPFHLLNFYPTIQVSYEQRVFPRLTLQAEGGYVLDYGNDDESFENKRGLKVKLEGRYYLGFVVNRERIYYVALEPYMNRVNFNRYAIVEECFDGNCSHPYVRRFPYTIEYRESGVSAKAGALWYVQLRFFVDLSAGLTVRNIDYDEPPLPPRAGRKNEWFSLNIPNEADRLVLSPNLGLRIGYRFK
jgi:hypothetical protein